MAHTWTPRIPTIDRPPEDELINTLIDMLTNGKQSVFDCTNWLRFTSGYNYNKTKSYALVKEANDECASIWNEINKNTVENASNALHKDRADALKRGDNRLAFDIQKEINKITNLYKENIDISGEVVIKTEWGSK